jgi:hypothetical protein
MHPQGPDGGYRKMNAVLKKLQYRGQSPVLLLDAPAEFGTIAAGIDGEIHRSPTTSYRFALAFVTSLAAAEEVAKSAVAAIDDRAVLWLAYPKQTSKRYRADINRDTGNALMQRHGFTGVAMVSLDDDWSALRLKRIA